MSKFGTMYREVRNGLTEADENRVNRKELRDMLRNGRLRNDGSLRGVRRYKKKSK